MAHLLHHTPNGPPQLWQYLGTTEPARPQFPEADRLRDDAISLWLDTCEKELATSARDHGRSRGWRIRLLCRWLSRRDGPRVYTSEEAMRLIQQGMRRIEQHFCPAEQEPMTFPNPLASDPLPWQETTTDLYWTNRHWVLLGHDGRITVAQMAWELHPTRPTEPEQLNWKKLTDLPRLCERLGGAY